VQEPVYGAPALWIDRDHQEDASIEGCTVVTSAEILATHLLETIKGNLARLLTMRALRRLLDEFTNLSDEARNTANRKLLDDLIPEKVSTDLLLQVLRLLLDEQVSIRNLALILEAISEGRSTFVSADTLCEYVRQRLGFQIVAGLKRDDGTLPLLQLAPEWEDTFQKYQLDPDHGGDVALPPEDFNRLAGNVSEKLNKSSESGVFPAVVTTLQRRRFLRTVLQSKGIAAPVVSFEEIARDAKPSVVGQVAA
jgi:flagellar biosynthesis protein FlhA